MTEADIQNVICHNARERRHACVIPNVRVYVWESDALSITHAGWVNEYEIKITKSDFKADKNKLRKHDILRDGEAYNRHQYRLPPNILKDKPKKRQDRPNYFWYVCPEDIIETYDLPDYAGLMTVSEHGGLSCLRVAPILHRDKVTFKQKNHIIRSFSTKYWNLRLKEG